MSTTSGNIDSYIEVALKLNEDSGKVIDVAGKSVEEVLEQAINIIDTTPSLLDYEYTKPPKDMFYSWVFANGLR